MFKSIVVFYVRENTILNGKLMNSTIRWKFAFQKPLIILFWFSIYHTGETKDKYKDKVLASANPSKKSEPSPKTLYRQVPAWNQMMERLEKGMTGSK